MIQITMLLGTLIGILTVVNAPKGWEIISLLIVSVIVGFLSFLLFRKIRLSSNCADGNSHKKLDGFLKVSKPK